ncbi:MAG: (2Fe-2S) ferredoxin domain-containing protein [Spirochaetia bacterium]|nr:(2Fe-2S) ferredoxin domain-containing protein [Spirochaetia bacterium]
MKYKKHIFVCTNERTDGSRISCGEKNGMDLVQEFKKEMGKYGLQKSMRVQRSGCFDICEKGPSVVVYPEGVFYSHVKIEDIPEIVKEHLQNDRHVERLKLNF